MKFNLLLLISINASGFAQDTIPIYGHHYLVEKEIKSCYGAKDQLKCIDSLIKTNLAPPDYSGKTDRRKVYLDRFRKLGIYHFYAGYVNGQRGNILGSFSYFDISELYLDSLKQNGKIDEFKDIENIIMYQKTELCTKTYFIDKALFNQCNCAQFFPELAKKESTSDTLIPTKKENELSIRKNELWGEFYRIDTLRINNQFVSDSASIVYFKKVMQALILSKLQQNQVYFEMLGDPAINLKRDTIIYKFSVNYVKGKYEKKCELLFASFQNSELSDYIMFTIANLEFPGFINDLEIFIPIVLTTENAMNTYKATIYDDHFLIELVKLKPIDPK